MDEAHKDNPLPAWKENWIARRLDELAGNRVSTSAEVMSDHELPYVTGTSNRTALKTP
jgi:hypothetical protein